MQENEWEPNRGRDSLEFALHSIGANFKILHPLLIARYGKVITHHSDTMFGLVGLDIETNHTTGEPKLLGFSYDDGYYFSVENPTLQDLFHVVNGLINNSPGTQIVTWGNLDMTCIIRLFDPTDEERKKISRGISGNFQKGEWIAQPPLMREVNGTCFYVDHYITGRSLRLGVLHGSRTYSIWIYNISQFYETRIAETAKALRMEWVDFGEETHLIDWDRYLIDSDFRQEVLESNKQDARVVRDMATHLGSIFNNVFGAYPKLLVSAGSLADSAVSKMLNREDYASNAWRYLVYDTFKDSPYLELAESIMSECYSAGYVEQFGLGYFETAHVADVSSAYPDKIRQLPDLRNFKMFSGRGNPESRIADLESDGWQVFTAVIRGDVFIPEHLRFHPITQKTVNGQNFRPVGCAFTAGYLLEERRFCKSWGARFENEVWVVFVTKNWTRAPIADVSTRLGELRDRYRQQMRDAKTDEETILYDSMQYRVKVVDNALYGKTVAAVNLVEDIDGKPISVGLKAGDRYNQLYGAWITATTRIQLADACMELAQNGSEPVMAMTDSVYWIGDRNHLPESIIATHKTAGFFEPPETVHDFYVLKTGQYEYRKGNAWFHKVRGFNLVRNDDFSSHSFYRSAIKAWVEENKPSHAEDIEIPVDTRKLVTIGSANLEYLGLVQEGQALMRPFVLSGKQSEPFVTDWHKAIDDHVWLKPANVGLSDSDTPMSFLSGLHEQGGNYLTRYQRKKLFYLIAVKVTGKVFLPDDNRFISMYSWKELEEWSGLKKEWCNIP